MDSEAVRLCVTDRVEEGLPDSDPVVLGLTDRVEEGLAEELGVGLVDPVCVLEGDGLELGL
jgi:hypothetical protein